MNPPIIPNISAFLGEFLIGSQAVDTWYAKNPNNGFTGIISVTSDTCFLVSEVGLRANQTASYLLNVQDFFPSVPMYIFELPSACTNTKMAPSPIHTFDRATSLFSTFQMGILRGSGIKI